MTLQDRIRQLEDENARLRADAAKYAAVACHLLTGMRAQNDALGQFLLDDLPDNIIKGTRPTGRFTSPD